MAGALQTTIGGKFAPLINLRDNDKDIDRMITIYNIAVTDTVRRYLERNVAEKALRNQRCSHLCDERTDLKKRRFKKE